MAEQGWGDLVETYWPRRLLHIPTMTSVERSGSATYLDEDRPSYNILSYTWGRWQISDDPSAPALPVKGTTWAIPPVREEHFTVQMFEKVVESLATNGCQWAWIDIACIDQEDEVVKAEEVGRQASIFRGASQAFVWLSHASADEIADAIFQLRLDQEEIDQPGNPLLFEALECSYENFRTIFRDPWFTSLWTLQELVLRNDFDILSVEGDSVWKDVEKRMEFHPETTTGHYFLFLCAQFYDDVSRFLDARFASSTSFNDKDRRAETDMGEQIRTLLQTFGVHQIKQVWREVTNPHVLYEAAKHRVTSRPSDRIYAIMQVYNLRVGRSARPLENPTLDELRVEFSQDLNARCPILGQLYNHTRIAPDGCSWMITEDCSVPEFLLQYETPKPSCTIRAQDTSVKCDGTWIAFGEFIQAVEESEPSEFDEPLWFLSLDSGAIPDPLLPDNDTSAHHLATEAWKPETYALLSQYERSRLRILLLGTMKHTGLGEVASPDRLGLIGYTDVDSRRGGEMCYRRLGVCAWNDPPLVKAVEALSWTQCSIVLR